MKLNHEPDWITPLQEVDGRWYKREDLLRYDNGVNGKTRTSLHLADAAIAAGATELVYGGSVLAPALGRVASAAAYRGLGCTLVMGSNIESARRHRTVQVAEEAGARFVRSSVAYNPALQKRAAEYADITGAYHVPYGVGAPGDWSPEQVRAFLERDADQVVGLAEHGIKTLVVPFGSGNAAAGIFYGLATRGIELDRVVLMGVGPDRWDWLVSRLGYVGVDISVAVQRYELHPDFATYADRMPEHEDGIDFHPTYEGKVVRYLNQRLPEWWLERDGTTCMWIVGGPLI